MTLEEHPADPGGCGRVSEGRVEHGENGVVEEPCRIWAASGNLPFCPRFTLESSMYPTKITGACSRVSRDV